MLAVFLAAVSAKTSAPDGYTIFFTSNTTQVANPNLFKSLPYDPVADFTPLALLGSGENVLVVNAKSSIRSLSDLINAARIKPNTLTFAAGSASSRVSTELLQQMSSIKVTHIPYKSNPQAIIDLLGGQVDFMSTDTATGIPHIKQGSLRALAVTGKKRNPLLPDVPTMEEAGISGYVFSNWFAAYSPAGTPLPISTKLSRLFNDSLKSESVKQFSKSSGNLIEFRDGVHLRAFQADETARWAKIIKAAGIVAE